MRGAVSSLTSALTAGPHQRIMTKAKGVLMYTVIERIIEDSEITDRKLQISYYLEKGR